MMFVVSGSAFLLLLFERFLTLEPEPDPPIQLHIKLDPKLLKVLSHSRFDLQVEHFFLPFLERVVHVHGPVPVGDLLVFDEDA